MIDREAAMGQIGMAQMICRAYEEMLVSNVSEGGRLAERSLDALQARPLVKNQETAETMVSNMERIRSMRDRGHMASAEILASDLRFQSDLAPGASPSKEDVPPYVELGPTLGNFQVRNTVTDLLGITDRSRDRNKVQQLWADCIPCLDRPGLLDIDLSAELRNLLNEDLRARTDLVYRIALQLDNVNPFDDLCSLLEFLNFMCLPDLVLILKTLKLLVEQELANLRNISLGDAVFDLASALLRPYVMNLDRLLHTLAVHLMAPLSCIVSSLVVQMGKIPGTDGSRARIMEVQEEMNRGVHGKVDDLVVGQKEALGMLAEFLMKGVANVQTRLLAVEESIREFLGDETSAMGAALDVTVNLKNIVRLVSIVGTLISLAAKSKDARLCGDGGLTEDAVRTYVDAITLSSPVTFEPARTPDGRLEGFVLSAQLPGASPTATPDVAIAEGRFASFSRCLGARSTAKARDLHRWAMGAQT